MHLQTLSFAGYRSFAARSPAAPDRTLENLHLAPVTILLGKNNSGKSTVARLLRHVLVALGADGPDPFPMSGNGVIFGSSFRDVQHGENFFSPLDLEIALRAEGGRSTSLAVQLIQLGELAYDSAPVLDKCEFNGVELDISNSKVRGLLPDIDDAKFWRESARDLFDASCHIAPIRDPVKHLYSVDPSSRAFLSPNTNDIVAQMLLNDVELRNAVGAWMAENLDGWRVDVKQSLDVFQLLARRAGRDTNLADAGQGIQQVLPVVALCCWRGLGRGSSPFLDILEQPELHLHDAAHAALGDLLLSAVPTGVGTLVVETHSEALVLRIRRRIAEGLDPNMVSIVYIEDIGEGSRIRKIPINEDGSVEWWPEGVFSESYVEAKAIRQAQRRRESNAVRN